jgi:hypothetical protein
MEGTGGSWSCSTGSRAARHQTAPYWPIIPGQTKAARALCLELLATLSPRPIKRKSTWSFSQERCFAGFAAETQAPIMLAHQTKLSPTACAAVLQSGHEACDAFLRSNECKLPESHLNVYRSNDIGDGHGQLPGRARSAGVVEGSRAQPQRKRFRYHRMVEALASIGPVQARICEATIFSGRGHEGTRGQPARSGRSHGT